MTIIGIEKKTSGAMNLLVFDPMFHDNEKVTKHIGQKYQFKMPADLMRAYRRGSAYLKKYREFEILRYVYFPLSFVCSISLLFHTL